MISSMKKYFRVLTIAGSDSGGGAGLQADLKTFAALECYGMSAVTALTAQNTCGVTAVQPVPAAFVTAQLEAVFSDIGTDAVKIGMLHNAEVIEAVTSCLRRFKVKNVVLDPVMVAKGGDRLLEEKAVAVMLSELVPLVDVLTPNLPEAEVLLNRPIEGDLEMDRAAQQLAKLGARAVLLKGGHLKGEVCRDLLHIYRTDEMTEFAEKRIETCNLHGTGCTLSAALAAFLARGCTLLEAASQAKQYLSAALQAGASYQIGQGHGPLHHFYRYW